MRQDALLCSINDRLQQTNLLLAVLCGERALRFTEAQAAQSTGQDIAPLDERWEYDLWRLAYADAPQKDEWDELAEAEGLDE